QAVSENLNGIPSSFKSPATGCATVSTMRRAAVWGSSSASATELILPQGTPTAISLASQASARSCDNAALIRASITTRFSTRAPIAVEAPAARPLGMAQALGTAGKLPLVADADRDHAVLGLVGGVGDDARMAVAEAAAVAAGAEIVLRDVDQHGERGLVEREL